MSKSDMKRRAALSDSKPREFWISMNTKMSGVTYYAYTSPSEPYHFHVIEYSEVEAMDAALVNANEVLADAEQIIANLRTTENRWREKYYDKVEELNQLLIQVETSSKSVEELKQEMSRLLQHAESNRRALITELKDTRSRLNKTKKGK